MKKYVYLYINGLSDLGSRMNLLAFTSLLLQFPNSELWLMAFFLLRQIGALLSSLVAGYIADRFHRRHVMIISDVFAGLSLVLVVIIPTPFTACVSILLLGVFYTAFSVCLQASIPDIYGDNQASEINMRFIRLTSLASMIGFAIGGILTEVAGYKVVLLLDAGTFFISAFVLLFMSWKESKIEAKELPIGMAEGFQSILKQRAIFLPTLLVCTMAIGVSGYNYGIPLFAQTYMTNASTIHGFMWTALGVGSFIGSFLSKKIKGEPKKIYYCSVLLFIPVVNTLFLFTELWVVLFVLGLLGFIHAFEQWSHRNMIQQCESAIRGRLFGIQSLSMRVGFLIGFLLTPVLYELFSLQIMVILMQLITLMILFYIGITLLLGKGNRTS
ncbi:MFS transporter [Bacillus salitolerans]|uniref:MFS transporter n=1 Tax=Bacillus salitolerans TaxID=1437434 RepID=A0ABW4LQA9_9BACI